MESSAGWTLVDVKKAGPVQVRARFTAGGALRRGRSCRAGAPGPGDADGPPVGAG
jgi:hypothetical protein